MLDDCFPVCLFFAPVEEISITERDFGDCKPRHITTSLEDEKFVCCQSMYCQVERQLKGSVLFSRRPRTIFNSKLRKEEFLNHLSCRNGHVTQEVRLEGQNESFDILNNNMKPCILIARVE